MTTAPQAYAVVTLAGNPRPGSRTAAVTAALGDALHTERGGQGEVLHLDLAQLSNPLTPDATEALADVLAAVRAAEVLVVGTPTYKASYTGLLKAFLDLLPPQALAGVAAVPLITVGSPAHTLAADLHLRPLLLELGAATPTPAVVLLDGDLADIPLTAKEQAARLSAHLPLPTPAGARP